MFYFYKEFMGYELSSSQLDEILAGEVGGKNKLSDSKHK
jgi:hypothetical protein